jgi:hypothetical protein
MSVLETFYFLFEADAAKLDRGLDEANKKTDKLEKNLNETDAAGGKLGGTLLKMAGALGAAIGGVAAFSSLKSMIMETADAVDQLNDKAQALDIPVSELDAWGRAALMSGGTAEGFAESLRSINTGIVALDATGKGKMLPFLKEMGLSMADVKTAAKDPMFALLKMSEQFEKLSRTEAAGLGAKLGLDQGTINLLSLGRAEMEALIKRQKELGVVTEDQAEKAAEFNDKMDEWRAVFGTVKREIVTTLLPPLTDFLKLIANIVGWMTRNKPFVVGFFTAVAAVLIGQYAPAALAAAKTTWLMVAPWLATVAAVAAFAAALGLVVDDLYNFQKGNDSVTGEIAKKWPRVGQAIQNVGHMFTWLFALVEAFASGFTRLIEEGPEAALHEFSNAVNFLLDEINLVLPGIGDAFRTMTNYIQKSIEDAAAVWDWLVAKIEAGIALFNRASGYVKGIFGSSGDANIPGIPEEIQEAQRQNMANIQRGGALLSSANTPLASQTSSSITNGATNRTSNKTTNVTTGPITVNTQATDGNQVASAMGNTLRNEMRSAIDENDDGVVA